MQCEADCFVLLICLSVATIHAATSSGDRYTFPEDFMLGTATASYQTEGGWKEDGKSEQQDTNFIVILYFHTLKFFERKWISYITENTTSLLYKQNKFTAIITV